MRITQIQFFSDLKFFFIIITRFSEIEKSLKVEESIKLINNLSFDLHSVLLL